MSYRKLAFIPQDGGIYYKQYKQLYAVFKEPRLLKQTQSTDEVERSEPLYLNCQWPDKYCSSDHSQFIEWQ